MRFRTYRSLVLVIAAIWLCSCSNDAVSLRQAKLLGTYPSGSALAFFNGRLFLMGDDATNMLLLDEDLNVRDSIQVIDTTLQRLPKKIKQDFEGMAVLGYRKDVSLLLVGSGSLAPYRNYCATIDPLTKRKTFYDLTLFYQRLKENGIAEINMEGATALPGGLMLASRGNKSYPWNHLIFTDKSFFTNPDSAQFRTLRVGANTDTTSFRGVSGLDYAAASDKLLLTVSTENTYNSYSDGSIGKSYLWIIDDITSRKRISHINPDRIIDLESIDARFKGHKIESVCIIKETRSHLLLALAADDDKGQTLLFRVQVKK